MLIQVIVGAQFGSEGKGAVAGFLARDLPNLLAIRVAGPNAGHTVVGGNGDRWPLRQVPVAAVTNPSAELLIGPGSEIEPSVLFDEVERLDAAGYAVSRRLSVSGEATIIDPEHRDQEADAALTDRVGSTGKGVGAARAARLMRTATRWGDHKWDLRTASDYPHVGFRNIQIEGTQGYGLGLHSGYYPYCTSSDCRTIDFLAMAGIVNPWHLHVEPILVVRPHAIRVAGSSGPLEDETSWEALGLPTERTTVTHKTRRVGGLHLDLIARAVRANGGGRVVTALTMADHLWPELAGKTGDLVHEDYPPGFTEFIHRLLDVGALVSLLGTSDRTMMKVWY